MLKDIVTEATDLDVGAVLPMLAERMQAANPYTRQLVLGWIKVRARGGRAAISQYPPVVTFGAGSWP